MGADGHIKIWRDDVVRKRFPDCDELFCLLPTHYSHMLDGVKYHHVCWGDNLEVYWDDPREWYAKDVDEKRLHEFCNWLNKNGTVWEVWT